MSPTDLNALTYWTLFLDGIRRLKPQAAHGPAGRLASGLGAVPSGYLRDDDNGSHRLEHIWPGLFPSCTYTERIQAGPYVLTRAKLGHRWRGEATVEKAVWKLQNGDDNRGVEATRRA